MASEQVQTFPAFPEVNHPGLVRVQLQPEPAENILDQGQASAGIGLRPAQQHTMVGVTHEDALPGTVHRLIQHLQVDVGQLRGKDSSNAVGNFCFEVSLSYRRGERPRRVTASA
jgi:hypothetical protein